MDYRYFTVSSEDISVCAVGVPTHGRAPRGPGQWRPRRATTGRVAPRAPPSAVARTRRAAFGGCGFYHIAVRSRPEVAAVDPGLNVLHSHLNGRPIRTRTPPLGSGFERRPS